MPPVFGYYNEQPEQEVETRLTWLDYLIMSNPHSVMQVLYNNGYVGYLTPQDNEELTEAAYDFVEKRGDKAVIELLKVHPLYDTIIGISKEEKQIPVSFKNADGSESSIITTIKTINYKKVIETLLVIIGAIYLANKIWGLISD
jgi:hypothetical protein